MPRSSAPPRNRLVWSGRPSLVLSHPRVRHRRAVSRGPASPCIRRRAQSERGAAGDRQDDRREPVARAGPLRARPDAPPACRGRSGRGRAHTPSASRPSCRRTPPAARSSARRRLTTPSTAVPSASSPETSSTCPPSVRPPRADGVEVLEREADRIHHLVAAGTGRVGAMLGELLAHRPRPIALPRLLRATARSAAAGAAACRAGSRAPTCRAGRARCAWRATSAPGCPPCPSSPRRASSRTGTRRNSLP